MKKTRAEKKIADLRRNLELSSVTNNVKYPLAAPVEIKQYSQENSLSEMKLHQPQIQSLYIYPVQLIRKDLTKTLVLCILAISLELGLYILLEKPGLLPF